MITKKKAFTIPNILSGYRLLAFPFILYMIFSGERNLFFVFLIINLITDILDGLLARVFKLETELGAKLDSLADIGTYILALTGMIILEKKFVSAHSAAFITLIVSYILPQLFSIIRFGRTPSFHLYSNKIAGYLQGIFIFFYFKSEFFVIYFYFMIAFSVIAYLEELCAVYIINEPRSNIKSIYFLLKERK